MTHPSSTVKDFSSSRGDRRIRVLIEEFKGFAPTTFSETEVERVVGLGEEHSALVLRSGVKIPVALSFEQLEQKIYEPDFHTDGPVLDLRTVTGEVAAVKPVAANDFAEAKIGDNARRVRPCEETIEQGMRAVDANPPIGAIMTDGTVYAGISPDTNKPMYAVPADASLTMTFNEATEYAARLDAHGHRDWRVPTKNELNVLFNNRVAIGGFNLAGPISSNESHHWSASRAKYPYAWVQRFRNGAQSPGYTGEKSSLRCVR